MASEGDAARGRGLDGAGIPDRCGICQKFEIIKKEDVVAVYGGNDYSNGGNSVVGGDECGR